MDLNRKTAYKVLLAMEDGAYSNLELNRRIGEDKPDNPAFVRELVYGVTENRIYIDYKLGKLIKKGIRSVKKDALTLLRMGAYQIEFMDSVPTYAAVNETVKMARKLVRGRDKFVNGVLRSYEREMDGISLPSESEDPVSYLSVKYSAHPDLVRLFLQQRGRDEAEKILKASFCKPDMAIRVNLTKTTVKELTQVLQEYGFAVMESPVSSRSLVVKGKNLLSLKEYEEGMFSVQDSASTLAADTVDPLKGQKVLDMCSAPGGKTIAMAEAMEDEGQLIAMDVYEHRVELIDREAKRLGLHIIKTAVGDSQVRMDQYEEYFDRVLADVPCSGLGVIRRKPEIKLHPVEDNFSDLSNKQLAILQNAGLYLKKGGMAVYSTCTINRTENEAVVDRFLDNNKGFSLISMKQLMPDENQDGFFIALIRKDT